MKTVNSTGTEISKEPYWQPTSTEAYSPRYFRTGGLRITGPTSFLDMYKCVVYSCLWVINVLHLYKKITDFGPKVPECKILELNAFNFVVNFPCVVCALLWQHSSNNYKMRIRKSRCHSWSGLPYARVSVLLHVVFRKLSVYAFFLHCNLQPEDHTSSKKLKLRGFWEKVIHAFVLT